ncbi:MAG: hypothetical protein AAF587_07180 [Bacteroidota bacterium]
MISRLIVSFFAICLIQTTAIGQNMDNEKLEKILYVVSDTITGQAGYWQMMLRELPILCMTDQTNNRMRIISPVSEMEDVTKKQLLKCMEANFHTALDVKYAVSDEILWVAYIHPLKELSKNQVIDAITQVYNAAITYGDSYSSTNLTFPKKESNIKKN